jgi:ribosomal protein S18 acetylase RimI-like enzyme
MEKDLIRECTHKDIDEVLQLDRLWEQENIAREFEFVSREEFAANLERFQTYFLVAESNGSLVGYINGTVRPGQEGAMVSPEHEVCLEIENIYVKPDFRNRHIGGKLMESLLEVAEKKGIQRFLVATDSKDMDKVLNFYQRYGFQLCYVRMFK